MLRRIYAFASIPLALLIVATTDAGACCSQRTFVSSHGNDANACTLTAPCRGFAAAIAQAISGGEVVVLDSAGYGAVTIDRSITITAPSGVYAGISVLNGQTGVVVDGAGVNVVLRGLTINGASPSAVLGVHFVQGARLRLESCVVSNIPSIGILQDAAGSEMSVVDTVVRDNASSGIATLADANVLLDGARLERNGGDGFQVKPVSGTASAVVRNSVSSFNGAGGLAALRNVSLTGVHLNVESSVVADNAGDGVFAGGIATGGVYLAVTRSTLARNGLSGASIFDGAGGAGAAVNAYLSGDQFSSNHSNGVKADGSEAVALISGNSFASSLTDSYLAANGGQLYSFHDNSGSISGTGTLSGASLW